METERVAAASCALGMLAYAGIMSLFPASDATGAEEAGPEPIEMVGHFDNSPIEASGPAAGNVSLQLEPGADCHADRPLRLN